MSKNQPYQYPKQLIPSVEFATHAIAFGEALFTRLESGTGLLSFDGTLGNLTIEQLQRVVNFFNKVFQDTTGERSEDQYNDNDFQVKRGNHVCTLKIPLNATPSSPENTIPFPELKKKIMDQLKEYQFLAKARENGTLPTIDDNGWTHLFALNCVFPFGDYISSLHRRQGKDDFFHAVAISFGDNQKKFERNNIDINYLVADFNNSLQSQLEKHGIPRGTLMVTLCVNQYNEPGLLFSPNKNLPLSKKNHASFLSKLSECQTELENEWKSLVTKNLMGQQPTATPTPHKAAEEEEEEIPHQKKHPKREGTKMAEVRHDPAVQGYFQTLERQRASTPATPEPQTSSGQATTSQEPSGNQNTPTTWQERYEQALRERYKEMQLP